MKIYFAEYRDTDIIGAIEGNIIKIVTKPNGVKYSHYVEIEDMSKATLEYSIHEALEQLTVQIDKELNKKEE